MGSDRQPSPEMVVDLIVAAAQRGIQKVSVATVVTFVPSPAPGKLAEASVQPMIMDRRKSGTVEPKPQLPSLPVLFPGGGGWALEWGLSVGDPVLVVCADEDIHAWLDNMKVPAPPQTGRRHDYSDGMVLPIFGPQSSPVGTPSNLKITGPTGVVLNIEGATGIVNVGAEAAADFVALAAKVDAELAKVKAAIAGAAVSAGDGGATFKSNIVAALNFATTAATKTKAT